MMTDEEYDKYEDALLEGRNPQARSLEKVRDVPVGFKSFISENSDRIAGWKNAPYWVKDNFKQGNIDNGLKFKTVSEPVILQPYDLNPESLTQLKALGVEMENENLTVNSFNSKMKGFDLSKVFTDFDSMGKQHGITWLKKSIVGTGSDRGTFLITKHIGSTKNGEVYIERHFKSVDSKTEVYHAYFKIPQHLQGGGMSKQVLGSYYEQYKNAGISKVKVTANIDVGGYTWARYGFSASNPSDIIEIISSRSFKLTFEQEDMMKGIVRSYMQKFPGKPFPVRLIADLGKLDGTEIGKKVLLGSFWSGELNLADNLMKQTFEDYLNGTKKKK